MKKRIFIKGATTKDGEMMIYGCNEMLDFLKKNPGKRLLINMEVFDPRTNNALKGFYFGKIIPDIQTGFYEAGEWLTQQETEQRMRELCPLLRKETYETGQGYTHELKTIEDLDTEEILQFIEFIRQYAALNLHTFVYHPLTI